MIWPFFLHLFPCSFPAILASPWLSKTTRHVLVLKVFFFFFFYLILLSVLFSSWMGEFSKHNFQTGSITITCTLCRNGNSQTSLKIYWIKNCRWGPANCGFNQLPRWCCWMPKLRTNALGICIALVTSGLPSSLCSHVTFGMKLTLTTLFKIAPFTPQHSFPVLACSPFLFPSPIWWLRW